jgi:hypothetical protein
MSTTNFRLPATEFGIIWRYLDGVSQALARRFEAGSSPGEENLTFLLCELLDEGTTSLHLLEYPLARAKEDLAKADGGVTLDVSFKTHEHTKYVEHHFSGADLGLVFVIEHPYFGRSERAVLLQAKRLFPTDPGEYTLTSSFKSFHSGQRDLLTEIASRFSARHSVFYLWYAPASNAFAEADAKLIRSLEATDATAAWDWRHLNVWGSVLDEIFAMSRSLTARYEEATRQTPDDDRARAWRASQPAIRVSALSVVEKLTASGCAPQLISLYQARTEHGWHRLYHLPYEPLGILFLLGLLWDEIGHSSTDWLRLARGEKIRMPPVISTSDASTLASGVPDFAPAPRHSLTLTLRSSLDWPQDLPRPDR